MQTNKTTNNPLNWIWLLVCTAILFATDLLLGGYAALTVGLLMGWTVWTVSSRARMNLFWQVILGLEFVVLVGFLSSGLLWGTCGLANLPFCSLNEVRATTFANFALAPAMILIGLLGEGCFALSRASARLFHKKVRH